MNTLNFRGGALVFICCAGLIIGSSSSDELSLFSDSSLSSLSPNRLCLFLFFDINGEFDEDEVEVIDDLRVVTRLLLLLLLLLFILLRVEEDTFFLGINGASSSLELSSSLSSIFDLYCDDLELDPFVLLIFS